ncbi:MAG TPA: zinc-binding alcohol dehydrogenase family protein [Stellaceae bacterium]|nr:zinc-binding alcohol dehydrogenase family protein [Stellaceae bacterium]
MTNKFADRTGEAVVMRRYGPPDVLRVERVTLPELAADEIRVRALAAAINHSDLEIRAGTWPILRADPFPYTPGLEVVGEVVEIGAAVSRFRLGERIVTMMQGLGGVRAHRPGGYAEYIVIAADAAAPVPVDLDVFDVAALGLAAVTAFEGLRKLGKLDGRRIAITGAAGGVGSAAIGIAKAQGAEIVAVISRRRQEDYVRALGATAALVPEEVTSGALGEESLDGVLDAVGGTAFGSYVAALKAGGALSLIGAVAGGTVSFDAWRLLETTLTGYGSESLDGASLRHAMARICDWLRSGALAPPSRTIFPLAEAAAAHEGLERHGVSGRVLLVPPAAGA